MIINKVRSNSFWLIVSGLSLKYTTLSIYSKQQFTIIPLMLTQSFHHPVDIHHPLNLIIMADISWGRGSRSWRGSVTGHHVISRGPGADLVGTMGHHHGVHDGSGCTGGGCGGMGPRVVRVPAGPHRLGPGGGGVRGIAITSTTHRRVARVMGTVVLCGSPKLFWLPIIPGQFKVISKSQTEIYKVIV